MVGASPAAALVAASCLISCASGLANGPRAFLNKNAQITFERAKIMTMGADAAADTKRRQVVAALKRFDQLAAMSSRGDPEGCSTALTELEALRETGAVFELGPNAHNRAMRVCSAASVQDRASSLLISTMYSQPLRGSP